MDYSPFFHTGQCGLHLLVSAVKFASVRDKFLELPEIFTSIAVFADQEGQVLISVELISPFCC